MEIECTNCYYFQTIYYIGGIETFLYELAKKYRGYDLIIFYKQAESKQLERLRQYVRCVKYEGQTIKCKRAFFNFNLDIIDNVIADDYYLVIHGDYRHLESAVPRHPKINHVVGVSKVCANAYKELTGIDCEVCYNPLTIDDQNRTIHLVSASRLNDRIKGNNKMAALAKAMDEYCEEHNTSYQWTIFTDNVNAIKSDNVVYMKPRLNVRQYMRSADYVVQLSDNVEGYNYTVNEALAMNVPVVITPCEVYKELGIDSTMSIVLDFSLGNIKEVVEKIFAHKLFSINPKKIFHYNIMPDSWNQLLLNVPTKYHPNDTYLVKATNAYKKYNLIDAVLKRVPEEGEEFIVTELRLEKLINNSFGEAFVEVVDKYGSSKK